jgi:hypothetical protein
VLLTGGKKAKVRLVELDPAIRSVPNTTNISKKQKIVSSGTHTNTTRHTQATDFRSFPQTSGINNSQYGDNELVVENWSCWGTDCSG